MNPRDLIQTARTLLPARGKPRQSDLLRATSTAYYVLFHTLARSCADTLIGTQPSRRSNRAWKQAYRALEHGFTKNACKSATIMQRFPDDIQDFANAFVTLQEKRHKCDYDPTHRITKSSAEADIDIAEDVIQRFKAAPITDRRAFAAFVLLKMRQ